MRREMHAQVRHAPCMARSNVVRFLHIPGVRGMAVLRRTAREARFAIPTTMSSETSVVAGSSNSAIVLVSIASFIVQ